ncbi:MAG: hypothetical protein COB78_05485 [Hyphomicrobiales bacterium]|nr:MAG: hypothetical protein COB78_05485 [Hyphomicrobiales bacterium]
MRHLFATIATATVLLTTPALANDYTAQLTELAKTKLQEIAHSADVKSAIMAQNAKTTSFDQAKIDTLDKTWRAEVDASSKPMIDKVLANATSAYLKKIQEQSSGLFTEIFAMDAKGLNVGQSSVTSDYWQGDEAKWQKTYSAGANSLNISEVEEDESTQTFQSQVSIPVLDDAGNPIGAITFGVNVELL